jgi:hypothetical protein
MQEEMPRRNIFRGEKISIKKTDVRPIAVESGIFARAFFQLIPARMNTYVKTFVKV